MTADVPPRLPCLQRAETAAYIESVKGQAYARWMPDPSETAADEVVIAFRLDADGGIASSEVRKASSESAGRDALAALSAAAPYPPMPPEARCLAGTSLVATFTRAEQPATAPSRAPPDEPSRIPHWPFVVAVAVIVLLLGAARVRRNGSPALDPLSDEPQLVLSGEQRFYASSARWWLQVLALGMGALAMLSEEKGWFVLLTVLAAGAALYEIAQGWLVPVVRISPWEIEVSSSYGGRRKLSTAELASWVALESQLTLFTTGGEQVAVPIAYLSAKDQRALRGFLQRLRPAKAA